MSTSAHATPVRGFATPHYLSTVGGLADSPAAAVGSNGRAVVLWRQVTTKPRFIAGFRGVLGRTPNALGAPRKVPGTDRALNARAVVRPDGSAVACFDQEFPQTSGSRNGPVGIRCAAASPHGMFGAVRTIAEQPISGGNPTNEPSIAALLVRPDGRVLLIYYAVRSDTGAVLRWTFADRGAAFVPSRPLPTPGADIVTGGGLTADGTVVLAGLHGDATRGEPASARSFELAPGADMFRPAFPFASSDNLDGNARVFGTPFGTAVVYDVKGEAIAYPVVATRHPDGMYTQPVRVAPRPKGYGFVSATVAFTKAGDPIALAQLTRESGSDCGQQTFGQVTLRRLSTADSPPVRLSKRGQIADSPQGVTLNDGTTAIVWRNAVDSAGRSRLEYALRSPTGRLTRGRPLPILAARGFSLTSAGGHGLLVWITGSLPDGPSRVVAAATTTAKSYAPIAKRPAHPKTPCGLPLEEDVLA